MKSMSIAGIVAITMLVGWFVFPQQVARAAGAASFVISGPLDAAGNVKVAEQDTTELIATGRVDNTTVLENLDVSRFRQIRITTGDKACGSDDRLDISTPEASTGGSGFFRMDNVSICNTTSLTYDVPGRTLRIACFPCDAGRYSEIAVFGRRN